MPQDLTNPYRGTGLDPQGDQPRTSAAAVAKLLSLCPNHAETPLVDLPDLARETGVGAVYVKDERGRMGLGSFKALGAAFAIAREAAATEPSDDGWASALEGRVFVAASAGNHGLSVAAGAAIFGARAVIYLAETVPAAFADRLRAKGAEVVVEGADYESSMEAAMQAADANGWSLLSDSTWAGYIDPAMAVMEGYLQMAEEAAAQVPSPPTHILLQAGVGGMATAMAAHARVVWGDDPQIIVVEPDAAPAIQASIKAGQMVTTEGPVSAMGRLDCKTPSLVALNGLSRDADRFVTITEAEAARGIATLAVHGLETTPSGGAGLAALLAGLTGLDSTSSVLTYLSEGSERA